MSDTDKPAEPIVRQFAIVEIFGHRKHWAEIADVERAGGKFLRVHDVETDEVHNYGAAAVFNIHEISEARLNAHLAEVAAYKQATAEREARWAAEEEARRNARLLAVREPGPPDDDPEEYEEPRAIPDPLEVPHPLVPERQEPALDREIPF